MQSRDLVEAHRLFFSAKLYDHQGPIARGGGRTNPPPDRPRYEKCPDRARVKLTYVLRMRLVWELSNAAPPNSLRPTVREIASFLRSNDQNNSKDPFFECKNETFIKNTLLIFSMSPKKWPKVTGKKNKNSKKFGPKGHARSMKKGFKNKKIKIKCQNSKKYQKRS